MDQTTITVIRERCESVDSDPLSPTRIGHLLRYGRKMDGPWDDPIEPIPQYVDHEPRYESGGFSGFLPSGPEWAIFITHARPDMLDLLTALESAEAERDQATHRAVSLEAALRELLRFLDNPVYSGAVYEEAVRAREAAEALLQLSADIGQLNKQEDSREAAREGNG